MVQNSICNHWHCQLTHTYGGPIWLASVGGTFWNKFSLRSQQCFHLLQCHVMGQSYPKLSASYGKQRVQFLHLSYSRSVSGLMMVGSHVTSSVTAGNVFGWTQIYRVFTGCTWYGSWPSSCSFSFQDRAANRTCKTLVIKEVHLTLSSSFQTTFEAVHRWNINVLLSWFHRFMARCEKKCSRVSVRQWFLDSFQLWSLVTESSTRLKNCDHDIDDIPFTILNSSMRSALLRISSRVHNFKW